MVPSTSNCTDSVPPKSSTKHLYLDTLHYVMTTNLYDAHRQWAIRPKDERFESLQAIYDFTKKRKHASEEQVLRLNETKLHVTPQGSIAVNGSSEPAEFSNWAFGQLSTALGAPAKYLRTLPAEMARDCLQYGLDISDQQCKLLIRVDSAYSQGIPDRWASAFTGPKYGRIWDADVLESLASSVENSPWHVPPARPSQDSENSGLYASDHDMFVFMVNDENPVEIGNAKLGRGFFCWNSETGASTFGLTTFLYNYVCGNHIVWGAEQVQELKIIHRSHAPDRFYTQALPTLNRYVENRALSDDIKDSVGRAMNQRIGNTLEETLDWFKAKPFTKKEVINAWDTGLTEGEDVRNVWGIVQGLTAYARDMPHCDKKVNLERRAGKLLLAAAA